MTSLFICCSVALRFRLILCFLSLFVCIDTWIDSCCSYVQFVIILRICSVLSLYKKIGWEPLDPPCQYGAATLSVRRFWSSAGLTDERVGRQKGSFYWMISVRQDLHQSPVPQTNFASLIFSRVIFLSVRSFLHVGLLTYLHYPWSFASPSMNHNITVSFLFLNIHSKTYVFVFLLPVENWYNFWAGQPTVLGVGGSDDTHRCSRGLFSTEK